MCVGVCFGAFCGCSCLSKCIANISNLSMVRQIFTTRLGKSSIEKLMFNVYKYKAVYNFPSFSLVPALYDGLFVRVRAFFHLFTFCLRHFFSSLLFMSIACYSHIDTVWRFARAHIHFSHIAFITMNIALWDRLRSAPKKKKGYSNHIFQLQASTFVVVLSTPQSRVEEKFQHMVAGVCVFFYSSGM